MESKVREYDDALAVMRMGWDSGPLEQLMTEAVGQEAAAAQSGRPLLAAAWGARWRSAAMTMETSRCAARLNAALGRPFEDCMGLEPMVGLATDALGAVLHCMPADVGQDLWRRLREHWVLELYLPGGSKEMREEAAHQAALLQEVHDVLDGLDAPPIVVGDGRPSVRLRRLIEILLKDRLPVEAAQKARVNELKRVKEKLGAVLLDDEDARKAMVRAVAGHGGHTYHPLYPLAAVAVNDPSNTDLLLGMLLDDDLPF